MREDSAPYIGRADGEHIGEIAITIRSEPTVDELRVALRRLERDNVALREHVATLQQELEDARNRRVRR